MWESVGGDEAPTRCPESPEKPPRTFGRDTDAVHPLHLLTSVSQPVRETTGQQDVPGRFTLRGELNKLSQSQVHMAPLQAALQALSRLVVTGVAMRSCPRLSKAKGGHKQNQNRDPGIQVAARARTKPV